MANNSEVILYVNSSDPKKAYKNIGNKLAITETFRMKEPVDVLRPVFTIARSTMAALNTDWQKYNYCQIPRFGNRYYFMSLKTIEGGLVEASCTVDALSTYIEALKGTAFEIARASNSIKGDTLLFADETRPTQANRLTEIHKLTKLDEATGNNYVLTVAGG